MPRMPQVTTRELVRVLTSSSKIGTPALPLTLWHEGRQLAITSPIHVSKSERVPSGSESSGRSSNTPCPSVAIVMLHWGPEEVTKRCLQSLGRIAYPVASVILIDNTHTLSPSVTEWAHPLSL